ncbi:hypothetical protein [Methylomonas koyamae]|uniref:hypothetical protein n=1 Tax=Methylomonas koyamae TaxID=702114 RepID=UPI00112B0F4E|nr:hypothetical protein [Methylomonas koyamae]TPQ28958.1 hypothetical protein C2U68_03080 [Methylomonas koyamae]
MQRNPQRRNVDEIRNDLMAAYQQRRSSDASQQIVALNKIIDEQHAELRQRDWQLFTACATAVIAAITAGIVLYHWLAAPVIGVAGLECRL